MRKWPALLTLATILIGVRLPANVSAAVTGIGPFVGDHNEGFESFIPRPVNAAGATNLDNQPIFGGIGSCAVVLAAQEAGIYQNNGSNAFNLGASNAKVRSGTNGFGSRSGGPGIVFNRPVYQFGGYFGGFNSAGGSSITVTFYDSGDNLIDQTSFSYSDPTGALVWRGWASPAAIATVVFVNTTSSTDEFVMDDLQVNCDRPTLRIRVANNQVNLSWSTNFAGYQLQQLSPLTAPFTNWTSVATTPTNAGVDWQVILPATNSTVFRLQYVP